MDRQTEQQKVARSMDEVHAGRVAMSEVCQCNIKKYRQTEQHSLLQPQRRVLFYTHIPIRIYYIKTNGSPAKSRGDA